MLNLREYRNKFNLYAIHSTSIIIIIMEPVQNRGCLVLCLRPGAPSQGWWRHPSAQGQHHLQGDEREPEAQPADLTSPATTCMVHSEEMHHFLLEPRWDTEDPRHEGIHPTALVIWLYFLSCLVPFVLRWVLFSLALAPGRPGDPEGEGGV